MSVAKVAMSVARVAVSVATEVDAVTAVTVPVDVVDSREAAEEEDVGLKLGGLQREKLT